MSVGDILLEIEGELIYLGDNYYWLLIGFFNDYVDLKVCIFGEVEGEVIVFGEVCEL